MQISISQSILLSYKQCDNPISRQALEKLYFLGARSPADRELTKQCIEAAEALGHDVAKPDDYACISECPVRRYFESRLAFHLMQSIPQNNPRVHLLNNLLRALYPVDAKVMAVFTGRNEQDEYGGIFKLLNNPHYLSQASISQERATVLKVHMENVYLGCRIVERDPKLPINIYDQGYFAPEKRGRAPSKYAGIDVVSTNFGLTRPTTPTPRDETRLELLEKAAGSTLTAYQNISFKQARDFRTFAKGQAWTELVFPELVHPYSNSISGSFLFMLRVIALLFKTERTRALLQPYFKKPDDFMAFFAEYSVILMHFSGGHSFREFADVLAIPAVVEHFKDYGSDLRGISMDTMYRQAHPDAFKLALHEAVTYMNVQHQRAQVNQSIIRLRH